MALKVAVIGGGAAGIVTLKYLATAHKFFPIEPIDVRLFESEDKIGGTFRYRVYDRAELVSSKYLTAFSDFRLPEEAPDFITPEIYCRYLHDYCSHFRLWRYIECSTKVIGIHRSATGGHVVSLEKPALPRRGSASADELYDLPVEPSVWECDAIAVCSGINVNPHVPNIPGMQRLINEPVVYMHQWLDAHGTMREAPRKRPRVIHAAYFHSAEVFPEDGTVVILGAGESAHDIAELAVTARTKSVIMCHRDGFMIGPKRAPTPIRLGRIYKCDNRDRLKPIDTCVASLFDTAYVPPVLQRGPLLWEYYDKWIKGMFWLISGTSAGLDQWAGEISKDRHHIDSILVVKSDRAAPYISAPYRSGFRNAIRSWFINVPIPNTKGRHIDLAPWPTYFDDNMYMHFAWSNRPENQWVKYTQVKPDLVVLATGYETEFPFIPDAEEESSGEEDEMMPQCEKAYHCEPTTTGQVVPNTAKTRRATRPSEYPSLEGATVRGIYRSIEDMFAYIGFVRPSFGAIPPLAELQAQLWVYRLVEYVRRTNPGFSLLDDSTADVSVESHSHRPTLFPHELPEPPTTPSSPTSAPAPGSCSWPIRDPTKSIAPYELDYALHARGHYDFFRAKYGVDHESYAYQLAVDIGSAPTVTHVWKKHGRKVFFTWAMGPNFNTKFRLVGPWAEPEHAHKIMERELYQIVRMTGGGVFFFTYTIIPLVIFGFLSLAIMAFQGACCYIGLSYRYVSGAVRRVTRREKDD